MNLIDDAENGGMSGEDQRYITTPAGFTFCRDCGSLVMAGYSEEHDRMHPDLSCEQVHPTFGVNHPDGHQWEEVYPRKPDSRAGRLAAEEHEEG